MPVEVVGRLPTESNYFRDPEAGDYGIWKDFQTVVNYIEDDGLLQLPVAGPPGTPAVFVRTHAAIMRKVVTWRAMKAGGIPEVPSPDALGDNDVFMGWRMSPAVPVPMANGKGVVWSISGDYLYGLRKPFDPKTAGVPTGATPAMTLPAVSNFYPASSFRSDLLAGSPG